MKLSFFSRLFFANLILFVPYTAVIWYGAKYGFATDPLGMATTIFGAAFCIAAAARVATHWVFQDTLKKLRDWSDNLIESGRVLVDAAHKVSSASSQQAAAIQETVSTVTEMNATIKRSEDNARKSYEVANSSQKVATEGEKAVKEMIKAIDEINDSNNAIMNEIGQGNQRINEIVMVITEIAQKTKVINDIVFQTKLLSFNASVEAAKAGDHGKGFAVVAEEIGNLAQMSGTASKEIAEMLNSSIKRVNSIVKDTSDKVETFVKAGRTKVEAGIVVAHRCGDVLQQVVRNATEANMMISEISLAAKDQAQGMNEIAKAMSQLDEVTQQTTNVVQDTADLSNRVSSQAEALRNSIVDLQESAVLSFAARDFHPNPGVTTANHASGRTRGDVIKFPTRSLDSHTSKVSPRETGMAVGSDIPSEESPEFEDV